MKGLLKKDFYQERKYILISALFWMAISLIYFKFSKKSIYNMLLTNLLLLPMIIMQDLIGKEKESNSISYILSLPIDKKTYINEKLLFIFLLMVFIVLINIITLGLIDFFALENISWKDYFIQSLIYFFIGLLAGNLGLNFSINMGGIGFFLGIFVNIILFLFIGLATFTAIGNESKSAGANSLQIIIGIFVYFGVNLLIRRSTIKKMEKKRY